MNIIIGFDNVLKINAPGQCNKFPSEYRRLYINCFIFPLEQKKKKYQKQFHGSSQIVHDSRNHREFIMQRKSSRFDCNIHSSYQCQMHVKYYIYCIAFLSDLSICRASI